MANNHISIQIRSWTIHDRKGALHVLKDAAYTHVWPGFILFIRKKLFQVITVLISSMLYLYTLSQWMFVCSILLSVIGAYGLQWIIAFYYIYGPPLMDMNDVFGNYISDNDNHFWIAELTGDNRNSEIAGTIAIVRKHQELIAEGETKVAWLRRMAVASKFRRLGIAEKLIKAAVDFCKERNYDKISLITTEVHQPARNLYRKLGFKCQVFRPYFYLKGLVTVWTFEFEMELK